MKKMNFTRILSSMNRKLILGFFALGFFLLWSDAMYAQGGDDCTTAVAIDLGTHMIGEIPANGNNVGSGTATGALWFSYLPTGIGTVTISACGDPNDTDTRIWVHKGLCGAFTSVVGDDDGCGVFVAPTFGGPSEIDVDVCPGELIFIEWDDRWFNGVSHNAEFELSFTPSAPFVGTGTAGETVVDAIPAMEGTNTAAGITNGIGGGLGDTGTTRDALWYSFAAPGCGVIDVASCLGGTDTRMFVYSGSASPSSLCDLTLLGTSDDACDQGNGSNFASEVTGIDVIPGVTYYVEWDDRWSNAGFDFEIAFTAQAFSVCPLPELLTNVSSTPTSATVTFAHCGTGAVVEYGPVGFAPGTGTILSPVSSPLTITGLTPGTDYQYYVTSLCSDGAGGTIASLTAGPAIFSATPDCVIDPIADVTESADAGVCDADVTIPVPTLSGADCNVGTLTNDFNGTDDASDTYPVGTTTVTYTVEYAGGGSAPAVSFDVVVTDDEDPTITCQAAGLTRDNNAGVCSFTMPGIGFDPTASGDNCMITLTHNHGSAPSANTLAGGTFGVGTTTVTWTATDPSGNTASCSIDIVVNDVEDPMFTACPSDMVINLGPGECSQIVNFNVEATDNCSPQAVALTQNTNPTLVDNSIGCAGNPASNTRHFRVFDLAAVGVPSQLTISSIDFGVNSSTGNPDVDVRVYTLNGAVALANLTLVSEASFNVPEVTTGTIMNFPINAIVPAGSIMVIELEVPSIPAGGNVQDVFLAGYNGAGQTAPTFLASCGLAEMTDLALVGLGGSHLVATVNGSFNADAGPAPITQLDMTGLSSGDDFPIGDNTLHFQATDAAGNSDDCIFTVSVLEFANATSTLTCNDLVQVSLDETCSATIGADDILEGGPYGCYDDFTVAVLSPVGQDLGNTVNHSFVGNTWTVKVTDQNTGNSCWGSIIVEDKLSPIIVSCPDVTIECTTPTAPAATVSTTASFTVSPATAIGPAPETELVSLGVNIPGSATVTDVNVRLRISHTFVADLDIFLTNPAGTQIELFSDICGGGNDIDVLLDDESGLPILCFTIPPTIQGVIPTLNGTLPGVYGPANGVWIFSITDDAGGDGGIIEEVGLDVTYSTLAADPAVFSDNCGVVSVDWVSSESDFGCGSPSGVIVRTWTATDASGNSTSCTQTITQDRPTLDEVLVPADIKWTCTQYNVYANVIGATPLHHFITDTDGTTAIIDVNLDPFCDDDDFNSGSTTSDAPSVNSTNTANGGNGCPGASRTLKSNPGPNSGLDDADVLELTGSGVPSVAGQPLADLCEIATDYEDIWITVCEGPNGETGTFKIVRQWTLIDWCANPVDVRQINQVIKVVDELAPSINLPTTSVNSRHNIDVYNSSSTGNAHTICEGSVIIPDLASATDNCSGVAGYVTEIWTIDNNGDPVFQLGTVPSNTGLFHNIPLFENGLPARYIIRYYASDYCDNQDFRDLHVTLRDRVPPVVVCDEITEVSITNNGVATGESCSELFAENLDDGSYDNCTPVYFLMAKMDDAPGANGIFNRCYYPSRDFCCDDLGDNTVILLVLDQDPTPFFNTNFTQSAFGCDEPTPNTPSLFLSTAFNRANYNTCMIQVQVTDKLAPVNLSCPADQRVTCDWWAQNIEADLTDNQGEELSDEDQCDVLSNFFGTATYFDNCDATVTCDINNGLDQCLEGVYRRTWSAIDAAGNTNSSQNCIQRIRVDHVSDWSVEFPADILAECGEDEPDFGYPIIFKETCELVAISFEDELFNDVPDACYKIARQWTVINWCVVGDDIDQEVVELSEAELWNQGVTNLGDRDINMDGFFNRNEINSNKSHRTYRDSWNNTSGLNHKPGVNDRLDTFNPDTDNDSDPWDGFITYQQVIKVIDEVDPVFTNGCQIPDVCIGDNTCYATVALPSPDITECSADVDLSVRIRIGGAWLNGFGPYLNVAPGVYEVRYVAMDNCNNQTSCESTVTVVDCKKPTPYCKDGIVVELMVPVNPGDEAMVEVWASDLNDASFDNCPGDLKFSFSSDVSNTFVTYNCDDLGQNTVEMWVTDAAGNQDFCITQVIIQANMGQCNDDPLIAGRTATEMGEGVQNVNIGINSPSGFDATMATDIEGVYTPTAVPAAGDYTVTPSYDEDHLNGVSTYDLVLISKHILSVELLDSPYQIIAADANKSNSVTTFDLVEIRKLILSINTEFPNNTSWRFVDKDYSFVNPSNPLAEQFPEVINFNNLAASQMAADFVAVKIGDVNRSASVNLTSTEDRNMVGDLVLNTDDVILTEGETYTVEFKATDFAVSGYQFTMNFDNTALDFEGVVSGLAKEANFGMTMVNEGVITTSWNNSEVTKLTAGDLVFGLTFTAKQSGRLSNMLNVNSRYTVAEAYNADAELLNVALSFNNTLVANGFELYQNTPNPFASTTAIGFYLPEATSATLTISDVQGKVVFVKEGDFAKGYNQVTLKRSNLTATGVLYYRLDTDNESATRKMILVD